MNASVQKRAWHQERGSTPFMLQIVFFIALVVAIWIIENMGSTRECGRSTQIPPINSQFAVGVSKTYASQEFYLHDSIDTSYLEYFRKRKEEGTLSVYQQLLMVAINNMFSDLANRMHPYALKVNSTFSQSIHPISFSIPEEYIGAVVPSKEKPFGSIIPGNLSTYVFETEEQYYDDMRHSMYCLTFKKGGWDCLRHLEILASGCVPLWTDIQQCPSSSAVAYPKGVLSVILTDPALTIIGNTTGASFFMDFNENMFDAGAYFATVSALLHYTKYVLSTKSMALYMLGNIQASADTLKKILYLTSADMEFADYQTDTLLHGLKKTIGSHNVVDFPRRELLYMTSSHLNAEKYNSEKRKMYGKGFSYGFTISDFNASQSESDILMAIHRNDFDFVIFGSGHRSLPPFYNLVCDTYPPEKVAMVHGGDKPVTVRDIKAYSCAGFFFSRE